MSEYLIVDTAQHSPCAEEEMIINSYSDEGYELVSVRVVTEKYPEEYQYLRYYFKKEV